MSLKLGDEFPNFHLKTTIGEFEFHEWLGDKYFIHLLIYFSLKLNNFFF